MRPARHFALRLGGGAGAARSVEDEIELGIVGEQVPRRRSSSASRKARRPRSRRPAGRDAGSISLRHSSRPVCRVVAGDVAAKPSDLAGAARDDDAVGDDRTAGIADKNVAAAIGLPHLLAGARIERDDMLFQVTMKTRSP